jgi:threonine dehydratase
VVLLDDGVILAGLRFAAERLKQVVEPAGAAALAAVLTGAVPLADGDRVCAILSGGNVSMERLGELIAGAADRSRREPGPPPGSSSAQPLELPG